VNVSRAGFLKVCGAALVGASLPSWSVSGSRSEGAGLDVNGTDTGSANLGEGEAARYRAHVGSLFTLEGVSQKVRLTSVEETAVHTHIEQFSLNFHAVGGAPITHGTYWFGHPALGRIEMFITRVGAPDRVPMYQACFSRIIRAKA